MWYLRHHLRRFFRMYMKPMEEDRADKWFKRMRLMYLLAGFSAFGMAMKTYFDNKEDFDKIMDLDPTHSHKMMRLRGDPGTIKVYKFKLGEKTQVYEYDNEEYIKEYNERAKKLEEEFKLKQAKRNAPQSELLSE